MSLKNVIEVASTIDKNVNKKIIKTKITKKKKKKNINNAKSPKCKKFYFQYFVDSPSKQDYRKVVFFLDKH